MKVETKLSAKSYIQAVLSMYFSRGVSKLYIVIGLAILFMYAFMINPEHDRPLLLLLLGLYWIIGIPLVVALMAWRNFKTNGRMSEHITYEFTEDRIKLTGESFYSEMDWAKVFKIIETKNWMLIYQDRMYANVVPLSSQL